jgi:hypothetical protein
MSCLFPLSAHGTQPQGAEWYVENLVEELDSPREWFFDTKSSTLYYMPNATATSMLDSNPNATATAPPTSVEVPVLGTLIRINGTQQSPVEGITFAGPSILISPLVSLLSSLLPLPLSALLSQA